METMNYISNDLSEEIKSMQEIIEKTFGIKINKVQASRIVAWKSRKYKINLTPEKLGAILLGKNVWKK